MKKQSFIQGEVIFFSRSELVEKRGFQPNQNSLERYSKKQSLTFLNVQLSYVPPSVALGKLARQMTV